MPNIIPKPFEDTGPVKTGFSIAVSEVKSGQFIRIGVSAAAQAKHFGGQLDPAKDALKLVLNNDRGANHQLVLELAEIGDPGAFDLASGIKGSVSVRLSPWGVLAPGKRPAKELSIIGGRAPQTVHLKLPDWARPEVPKIGQGRSIMD